MNGKSVGLAGLILFALGLVAGVLIARPDVREDVAEKAGELGARSQELPNQVKKQLKKLRR